MLDKNPWPAYMSDVMLAYNKWFSPIILFLSLQYKNMQNVEQFKQYIKERCILCFWGDGLSRIRGTAGPLSSHQPIKTPQNKNIHTYLDLPLDLRCYPQL